MTDSQSRSIFDEERLLRLIKLMKENGLRELELREAEQHIRLCRPDTEVVAGGVPMMPAPQYPATGFPPHPAAAQAAFAPPPSQPQSTQTEPESEGDNILLIKSPMVGTFYAKPNPGAQSYVRVGDHVEPETTICIIEAMKVFNEIPAEVRGKIMAILVDDEEPVEFGKPLFKVDTQA